MATAHLSVKVGKAGKGVPHAEYISRVGKYEKKLDGNEQLEATESGNMPLWAQDNPLLFWRAADLYERKNGTVYREHEIALPRELSPEHRAELVRDWVEQELGDRHAYTWAIHNKTALDGGEQPHVHLMFSERTNDGIDRDPEQYFKRYNAKHPERGGAKKHRSGETIAERKAALIDLRDRWEKTHNRHIRLHGKGLSRLSENAQINMKSYAEQYQHTENEKTPQRKMKPSESNALHRLAELERAAAEAVSHYDPKRVNDYFAQIHEPTAKHLRQEAQEQAEQQKAAERAAAKRAAHEQEKERYAAGFVAHWIEHAYERDKGILDMRGGDIEASKRIWLLARAANIETSQQFDDFVTNKQIGMAVEAARKKARLEAEAAGKGIAPEIAQAFQQRAERIAQEQETARQESEAAKREQQQPHQSKTVTAYKPPEQVKIKQNENQQPTQTQKKGRGIKH
ncbi:MobA/MobL family protein [Neisseria gonorrhoeae]|jgi:hypothetical protein|uniref:MobA/MobL family protein n=1 Tax=Kingella oralis ATCC 51147 TaxID=629741 RepID=C4GNB6_9NEIS|nr:MobA/MobL family protein [Kingella oralis]EEP66522.1 MobA/MobL family protein [Kingella oralis ATCC 51147]